MTTDEINRYIHVEIMEKCWHEGSYICQKCNEGQPVIGGKICSWSNPDYCSDDSPRWLLNKAVKKVASPNSYALFEDTLLEVIRASHSEKDWKRYNNSYLTYLFLRATAEQLATACIEIHKIHKTLKEEQT